MPLALVEHTRDMLPPELLALFPAATGGLFARTQFAMDVQLGRETYALYKMGAMDEWSIGFDYLQSEFVRVDGVEARLNKELKLWEYSPVTWGCNQATVTTAVKQDDRSASTDAVPSIGQGLLTPGTSVRAEPHQEDALTREKRLREIQILEADLAIKSARLRR
jgi:HK97 family phage prohead protease